MDILDLLQEINDGVKIINSPEFKTITTETQNAPSVDDNGITYENFDLKEKKCKAIKTCVLYIDIRKSTIMNTSLHQNTLVKLYSSFIRSMTIAAQFYGGSVKNIVGDRVMVVFPEKECCYNAVKTAILFNTISKMIINKYFINRDVSCGIGIDYGDMLVSKVGTIKQGTENSDYKSLVWLGRPANIASKLTDQANKVQSINATKLPLANSPFTKSKTTPPILMTEKVYLGYLKKQKEIDEAQKRRDDFFKMKIRRGLNKNSPELVPLPRITKIKELPRRDWAVINIIIDGCSDIIYGGNVINFEEMCKVR